MFEFIESIDVDVPAAVWSVMRDVGNWWPPSNPEHEDMRRLDGDGAPVEGARPRIRERIGGIRGRPPGESAIRPRRSGHLAGPCPLPVARPTQLLGGVDKDREHTRTELRFLRQQIEQRGRPPAGRSWDKSGSRLPPDHRRQLGGHRGHCGSPGAGRR